MKVSTFLFIIVLGICFFPLHAQKRYLFHNYTTKDGLINSGVYSINQDRRGFMWFATAAGVSKYDGYIFNNQVIPEINDNGAFSQYIEKDANGNLIFTSFDQGLLVEQPNGKYHQYLLRVPRQIGKNITRTLKSCPDGKILVSSGRSLYVFKDGKFKTLYSYSTGTIAVNTIEYDNHKNVWFGGIFGLAVIFASDTSNTPFFIPEFKNQFVMNILFDNENTLLVGTQRGYYTVLIKKLERGNMSYSVIQPIEALKETSINQIYKDRQSHIWIATSNIGVIKTMNNEIIENISIANGLPTPDIFGTFQDQEGNFWFATANGVSKLVTFANYSFSFENKQVPGFGIIVSDKFKRLWLSDGADLYVLSGTKVSKINLLNTPFKDDGIDDLYASASGSLFIINRKGLYVLPIDNKHIDLKNSKLKIDFLKADISMYRCIMEDKDMLLIGSDKGIFAFKNNRFTQCVINLRDNIVIRTFKIIKDQFGYYWIGDFNYGLYRLHLKENLGNSVEFDSIKVYKSSRPDSSFVTKYAAYLALDHAGNLWMSSFNTGVYKLKIDKSGVINYKLYSIKNGLSGNYINLIEEDNDHNIWITTKRGANCIRPDHEDNISVINFNSKNGLGDEVFKIFPTDSFIYISYAEGLYAVDIKHQNAHSTQPPQVIISAIDIMGKPDSVALQSASSYVLPYNQNFLSFEFASISFNHENGILYQYKLDGLDKDWSPQSDRRFVNYNSLAPGKYIFRVRAIAENSIVSSKETIFSFIITPPFYKTWWFILFSAIALISLAVFVYQYRIKQLLKLEKLRTRIASDLHDDVGSTLSSISILSEILSTQLDKDPKSAIMIGKIGANARNMLESMDDIIWSVNPANDKFQNLGLRIREYAIPLFESKNIKFNIHFSDQLAMLPLQMDIRRNVYLIAKEAVNNMVKYSECGEAEISFYEHNSRMVMSIRDNGKGFDPLEKSSRNGLKSMQYRANQIEAILEIQSALGKGTTIKLQVKIS